MANNGPISRGNTREYPAPPLRVFVIFFQCPIMLGYKWHYLLRHKSVPTMYYLQKCDADPKIWAISDFSRKNLAKFKNIYTILRFSTHIHPMLQEHPQQVTTKFINNARIVKSVKIGRHFSCVLIFRGARFLLLHQWYGINDLGKALKNCRHYSGLHFSLAFTARVINVVNMER